MKLLPILASFFFSRFGKKTKSLKETALEIFDEITFKSRRLVTLTLTAMGTVIFFCGGFFIALLDGTSQYDRVGYITSTATLWGGLSLVFLGALVFSMIFLRAWPQRARTIRPVDSREASQAQGPSLENALALLVLDFIKERELRRTERATPPSEPAPASSERASEEASTLH